MKDIEYEDEERRYEPTYTPPQSYSMPMMAPSEKADLLDKIRPDLVIEVIRYKLMGQEMINGRWREVPALKNRKLTQLGAWEITNLMFPASTTNVSISKIKDADIRKRTESIVHTALRMCLRNWKEYGITGSDQIHFVKEVVQTNTFVTLKQPDEGSIQNLIKGTTHEQRMVSSEEKKPNWLASVIRR